MTASFLRLFTRQVGTVLCVALAWGLVPAAGAAGENPSETQLRAAFVYNFAKFTEWPADVVAPSGPISLCVIDDRFVAVALKRLVEGRTVGNHSLMVLVSTFGDDVRRCHVLYAPVLDGKRMAALLATVGDLPVLTISDNEGFAVSGGVANFLLHQGRMRFVVNVDSAQRARLQVSSKLLTLAKLVKDGDAKR